MRPQPQFPDRSPAGTPPPAPVPAPLATRRLWNSLVRLLVGRADTPFFLFSVVPVEAGLRELERALQGLPVRHWWSAKTQSLPPLWRWWRDRGLGLEVVSEFELRAALAEGFESNAILVNGPAKHHWLYRYACEALVVNFDSVAEAVALARLARTRRWRVGLRLQLREGYDPEHPTLPTQFGMSGPEAALALRRLRQAGLEPEGLHFHLRTQVESAAVYERALREAADLCAALQWRPRVVDCGGGWPAEHVRDRQGRAIAACFSVKAMTHVLRRASTWFAGLREYWLEIGRRLSAPGGVLVVRVLDIKQRAGWRYLICDGGRTLHAMVSTWEQHGLLTLPARRGPRVPTIVTGPTCMAFDQLARCALPATLRAGDTLIWLDAGAYHLSWETRFSHGLAAVYWHDGRRIRQVRAPESFEQWWGLWKHPRQPQTPPDRRRWPTC